MCVLGVGRPSCTSPQGSFLPGQEFSSEAGSPLPETSLRQVRQAWPTWPPGPGTAH